MFSPLEEGAFSRSLQGIYYLLSLNDSSNHSTFTIITWNDQPQQVFQSYWSHLAAWTSLQGRNGLTLQAPLRQAAKWRAPPSGEKVSFKEVSLLSPALENKSVVLASTAIQLLDDRKSPIVAGKTHLTKIKCYFIHFSFHYVFCAQL